MTFTQQLYKDVHKCLKSVGKGSFWLAGQIGVPDVSLFFFLSPKYNTGKRGINYETGAKLRAWADITTAQRNLKK